MSIEICECCEARIDTDYDSETYVEKSDGGVFIMCRDCRSDYLWMNYLEYEDEIGC